MRICGESMFFFFFFLVLGQSRCRLSFFLIQFSSQQSTRESLKHLTSTWSCLERKQQGWLASGDGGVFAGPGFDLMTLGWSGIRSDDSLRWVSHDNLCKWKKCLRIKVWNCSFSMACLFSYYSEFGLNLWPRNRSWTCQNCITNSPDSAIVTRSASNIIHDDYNFYVARCWNKNSPFFLNYPKQFYL